MVVCSTPDTLVHEKTVPGQPLRVCHIIANLQYTGGAQTMLCNLLANLDPSRVLSEAIALIDVGPVGKRIEALGIPVAMLGMRRPADAFRTVARLAGQLRKRKPHIVQTWMYHADLIGGLAARFTGLPVVWNVRHSKLDRRIDTRATRWTAACCARLSSRLPARIVVNSLAGRDAHRAMGYCRQRMQVIPNGFDLAEFKPSGAARRSIRRSLGIGRNATLVGMIGRFHPQKNHAGFVVAAAQIAGQVPGAEFLLCGSGVTWQNARLARAIQGTRFGDRFHLLGRQGNMAAIHASLDLAVLPSTCSEGFPNVVGESMACGVPCVVTDVGDAAAVVGDTGRVVTPGDPDTLARACLDLLQMPAHERMRLGACARQRIEQHFSIARITRRYTALWRNVVTSARRRRSLRRNRAA